MGLFSRIREFFTRSRSSGNDEQSEAREALEQEAGDILTDDDMDDVIWGTLDEDLDDIALKDFAVDRDGAELFRLGWMDSDGGGDDVTAARQEFFELMEEFDISRDEFDWDAWRDWYED